MTDTLQKYHIEQVETALDNDDGINLTLENGLLYIERKLPFLLVYRPTEGQVNSAIKNIIRNEASYLLCSADSFSDYRPLLEKVVKKLSDEFGALLLVEIWPHLEIDTSNHNKAGFEIFGPGDYLPESVNPLFANIKKMDLAGLTPIITLNVNQKRCPPDLEPLIDRKELKQLECLLLGLQIEPFYMDYETGHIYPILVRKLYSEFSKAFKKTVFDFVKVQANNKISGYQSLAKHEIKAKTWEIDKQLVDIDKQFNFLLLSTPVNGHMAWAEFKKNHFRKEPVFHYRMLPNDPEILKRTLYNIRIEEIDDPTLGFLFRDKRAEVDKMLTMLNERETPEFLYGSLQVFGNVSNELLLTTKSILEEFPVEEYNQKKNGEYYTALEFAELARQELLYMKNQWPGMSAKIEIKDTITDLIVDKNVLNIPARAKIPKNRAEALIQHELGTHVLTYLNGVSQPLKLLSSGVPGYEQLQEGIAVLTEYLTGGLTVERMQLLAARVIAVDSMINEQNFIKTFEMLTDGFHFRKKQAFRITTRVYRSGGLTKDAVYFKGLSQLLLYLKKGNLLEPLLIGKIKQSYLPVINELIARKILKPIRIKPRYLYNNDSLYRLSKIPEIKNITELISR